MAHSGSGGTGGGILREALAIFGFDVDTEELSKSETKLEKYFQRIERMAKAFAGIFVAKEIFEFADSQAELLDRLDDTANALGITTERVQQFTFASKAMGDDADRLLHLMGRLQVEQEAAAQGGAAQAKAFQQIGVSVRDTNGQMKAADELFLDVADGISKQKDASKQAAVATALFGREGRALLPFLKEGRKGFQELADLYKELGGGYTREAIEKGGEFQKSQAKLNLTMTALKNQVLIRLLPILTKVVDVVTSGVQWIRQMTKDSYLLQTALGALTAVATVFAIEMAIANAPLVLITGAIAALILIIEDFVTMMEGGESVIGDLLDRIYGKDAHIEVVQKIKDAWQGVTETFKELWPVIQKVWDFFKWTFTNYDQFLDSLIKINTKYGLAPGEIAQRAGNAVQGLADPSQAPYAAAVIKKQAQARVDAQAQGLPAPPITEVPAGLSRANMDYYINRASQGLKPTQREDFVSKVAPMGGFAFNPTGGEYGPSMQGGDVIVNVHPAPGMDEKKLGEHAAKAVHEVIKQRNRAAAATLQRKVAQ